MKNKNHDVNAEAVDSTPTQQPIDLTAQLGADESFVVPGSLLHKLMNLEPLTPQGARQRMMRVCQQLEEIRCSKPHVEPGQKLSEKDYHRLEEFMNHMDKCVAEYRAIKIYSAHLANVKANKDMSSES